MSNDGWLPLTIDGSKHFVRVREGKVEHRKEEEHVLLLNAERSNILARTNHRDAIRSIYDSVPRADWPLGLRVLSDTPHATAEWVNPDTLPNSVSLFNVGIGDLGPSFTQLFPSFMTYARAAVYQMPDYPADATRKLRMAMTSPETRDNAVPPEAAICCAVVTENRLLVFMRATRALPKDMPTGAARATVIRNMRQELANQMNAVRLPAIDGVEATSEGWFESDFVDEPPSVHVYTRIGKYAVTAYDRVCSQISVNLPGASLAFATFSPQIAVGALPTTLIKRPH